MKTFFTILVLLCATSTFAAVDCTKEPKEKWQNQEEFQKKLVTEGYKIKLFKVTKGNCYEIYGWNKAQQKVEIYFNPVDGKQVKAEIK
jgi:hypothetical protein